MIRYFVFIAFFLNATEAFAKSIEFSGLWWEIKDIPVGPGNKHWCNDDESVWVNEQTGDLHLRINYNPSVGDWCQVEVFTHGQALYGKHQFQVISQLDQLDPDVVLGMFTYFKDEDNYTNNDCPEYKDEDGIWRIVCEIDIEITESFNDSSHIGNFIVQPPYSTPDCNNPADSRYCAFPINMPNGNYTSHRFNWSSSMVSFDSWHGHGATPSSNTLMYSWDFSGDDIPPQYVVHRTHINLWICTNYEDPNRPVRCPRGDGTITEPVEVIIRSYDGNVVPFEYAVDTFINGSGSIQGPNINCPNDCVDVYEAGTLIELQPIPALGWSFSGWGQQDGEENECDSFRIFKNKVCTAIFTEVGSAPDLVVNDINLSNSSPSIQEEFEISVQILNQGNESSSASVANYYYSEDDIISIDDHLLDDDTVRVLDPGEITSRSDIVSIDNVSMNYWVGVCVESVPGELNIGNNCSDGLPINLLDPGAPDLIISNESVSESNLITGEKFSIAVTVENIGGTEASAAEVIYYYSFDNNIEVSDLYLENDSVGTLDPGETDDESQGVAINETGNFWVGACVEEMPEEGNISNNCSEAIAITVLAADLIFIGAFE